MESINYVYLVMDATKFDKWVNANLYLGSATKQLQSYYYEKFRQPIYENLNVRSKKGKKELKVKKRDQNYNAAYVDINKVHYNSTLDRYAFPIYEHIWITMAPHLDEIYTILGAADEVLSELDSDWGIET